MVSFFAKVIIFRFWLKTMDYNKAFLPKSRCFSAVLLLHSGRCYEAEICVILFFLTCPFIISVKCYVHTSVGATTFTVHVHFEWERTKVLITPKLNELLKLPLLRATYNASKFNLIRWTVMEKWS